MTTYTYKMFKKGLDVCLLDAKRFAVTMVILFIVAFQFFKLILSTFSSADAMLGVAIILLFYLLYKILGPLVEDYFLDVRLELELKYSYLFVLNSLVSKYMFTNFYYTAVSSYLIITNNLYRDVYATLDHVIQLQQRKLLNNYFNGYFNNLYLNCYSRPFVSREEVITKFITDPKLTSKVKARIYLALTNYYFFK